MVSGVLVVIGPEAVRRGAPNPGEGLAHHDRQKGGHDPTLEGRGRGVLGIRRRGEIRTQRRENPEQGPGRTTAHRAQKLLAHPASAKQPVAPVLFPAIPGVDDVVPEMVAVLIEDPVRAPGVVFDGVEEEAKMYQQSSPVLLH